MWSWREKNPFERIFTLKGAWRNVRNVGFIRQRLYREALSLLPTLEGIASHFQFKSICESRWFTGSVCLGNVEIYSFNPSALPQPFSSPVHFYWVSFVSCLSSVEGSRKERLRGLREGLESRWNGKGRPFKPTLQRASYCSQLIFPFCLLGGFLSLRSWFPWTRRCALLLGGVGMSTWSGDSTARSQAITMARASWLHPGQSEELSLPLE